MSKRPQPAKTQTKVFNPKTYERPGLTEDEILEIKEAFDLFDTDGYIITFKMIVAVQSTQRS